MVAGSAETGLSLLRSFFDRFAWHGMACSGMSWVREASVHGMPWLSIAWLGFLICSLQVEQFCLWRGSIHLPFMLPFGRAPIVSGGKTEKVASVGRKSPKTSLARWKGYRAERGRACNPALVLGLCLKRSLA